MSDQLNQVYLDIGSNIDREKNIQSCVDALRARFPGIVFSKAYESDAVGFEGDPFINLSAGLQTRLDYDELKDFLKKLEDRHARKRDNEKFIARTLDVDILLFDDLVLQPDIDLPRAEILKFPFVLYPLAEIAADVIHPLENKPIADLAKESDLDKTTIKEVKSFPA